MMKKTFAGAAIIIVLLWLALFLKKAPIDPAAYDPPPKPPMSGVLAPNDLLKKADLLALGKINGPEEVAVDRQGRSYSGTRDGKILRLRPDGQLETFAQTGGRPLGMQFDRDQNLIVCDSWMRMAG